MDRITDDVLRDVIGRLERVKLVPPDDLDGDARAMFVTIADGNKARPWTNAHVYALADYCRMAAAWNEEQAAIEREGRLVGNKPNARYRVLQILSAERSKLAKLLGLQCGSRDPVLDGNANENDKKRRIGAAIHESDDMPGGHLLA